MCRQISTRRSRRRCMEQEMVANGSRNTRAVSTRGSKMNDQQPTADEVEDLLEDAEKKGH